MDVQGSVVVLADLGRMLADLQREVQHCTLARRDVGPEVIGRQLIRQARRLLVDTQDGTMGDHAVQALAGAAGGDDTIISRSPVVSPVGTDSRNSSASC